MSLKELKNIGATLEVELNKIGIMTYEDLVEQGSVMTVLKLGVNRNACYNKLYALEGAIKGVRWHDLSKEERKLIKMAYDEVK